MLVVFISSIFVVGVKGVDVTANTKFQQSGTLTQLSSGLGHYDPLNSASGPDTSYWTFGGDAAAEGGTYAYNENTSGLFIGASSPAANTWAGFYAASPNSNLILFHVQLTLLNPTLPASSPASTFNTGMYVQTSNGLINYVSCFGQTSSSASSYTWGLEEATGNTEQATSFTTLWSQSYPISDTQDLVQNCTIVTNGFNFLQLYMNGNLVYSTFNANLQIPSPFNVFLEVETTSQNMLYGKFLNFYDTAGTSLTVLNVPFGDTVQIVGSNGAVVAQSNGFSPFFTSIPIANYNMPISGSIEVLSGNSVVASTGLTNIWGGDVYQFRPSFGGTTTSYGSTTYSSTAYTWTNTYTSTTFPFPHNP